MDAATSKVPVILDTDIGDWIDDHWALLMLLNSPELDLKLVISTYGDTHTRACILAKTLALYKQSIPVAIGIPNHNIQCGCQKEWVNGYDLSTYTTVYKEHVNAILDVVNNSKVPVTIIAIGPLTNIARLLEKDPTIANKINLVAQVGDFGWGHNHFASWNITCHIKDAQKVLNADWKSITIVPYDVCGKVVIRGDLWKKILSSESVITKAVLENHQLFVKTRYNYPSDANETLFDTAAIYAAFSDEFLEVKEHGVVVDDKGFSWISDSGKKMRVATQWKDLQSFLQLLSSRLC